jgi:hypothetical protein
VEIGVRECVDGIEFTTDRVQESPESWKHAERRRSEKVPGALVSDHSGIPDFFPKPTSAVNYLILNLGNEWFDQKDS